MQSIVIDKPYQFVTPHRGTWWPRLIQRFRLVDVYLRRHHAVHECECRGREHLRQSLDAGHGILLTPNHPRTCDPIVMWFLARQVTCYLYAMASWHLFNQDRFTAWAIRRMGGFSVYREGIDRQAIDTAIRILATAERPLVIFPEGSITRTNDRLHALLDGIAFIAHAAAKRRTKSDRDGKVVVHPVALKYRFLGDLPSALNPVLEEIERRLSWQPQRELALLDRITKVGMALLTLKEIEYFGRPQIDSVPERLGGLIDRLLCPMEENWLGAPQSGSVIARVKAVRMKIMPDMVKGSLSEQEKARRWRQLADIYLAQQVSCYPPDYLTTRPSVDRLLETVERFEEDLTDQVRAHGPLKVIIHVGPAIPVGPRGRRGQSEAPLLGQMIHSELQAMLDELALESPLWEPTAKALAG